MWTQSAERMKDVRELNIGTLNVGATYTFCPLLADTVRDFMKKYPGIKLKVYCRSMENLMEMLEHGQLDVALSYKPLESYEDIDSARSCSTASFRHRGERQSCGQDGEDPSDGIGKASASAAGQRIAGKERF